MALHRYSGQSKTVRIRSARIETSQGDAPVISLNRKQVRVRIVLTCDSEFLFWLPTSAVRVRELDQVYIPTWLLKKLNDGLAAGDRPGRVRAHA